MERRGLGKVKYYFYFPKGVDALHMANHVRESCKREYPKVIKEVRENFDSPNTEAAEQTFVWLGKFKKIYNNMNKRHHFFFLHCLVEDRNEYISRVDDGSTFSRKSTFYADVPNWGPFLITLVVIKMLQYHVLLG